MQGLGFRVWGMGVGLKVCLGVYLSGPGRLRNQV